MNQGKYIWHVTTTSGHARKSYLSEVDPAVIPLLQNPLKQGSSIELPGGCWWRVVSESGNCVEFEVVNAIGKILVRIGVANHSRCGAALWRRLGAEGAVPGEPWCAVQLLDGLDQNASRWLGDFERCLAWAWLLTKEEK